MAAVADPATRLLIRAGGLDESELSAVAVQPDRKRRRPGPLDPQPSWVGKGTCGRGKGGRKVLAEHAVRKGDAADHGHWGRAGVLPDVDQDWPGELCQKYALDKSWRQRVGGFGAVQRATDRRTGAAVAIKRVFPRNFEKVTRAVKVLREARILSHLTAHGAGHVVALHDLVVPDDRNELFFVMDFVDTDLHHLLPPRTQGIGSFEQACYVFKRILLALRATHACGVVHRDLKPQNILVNTQLDNNVVFLCDFGFAREVADDGMMTQFGTSHSYWAPEMMVQDAGYSRHVFAHGVHAKYGTAADLWAAGAMFAELLGWGRPMFQPDGSPGDFWDFGYEHGTLAMQLGHVDTLNCVMQVMGTPTDSDLDGMHASDAMRKWISKQPKHTAHFHRQLPKMTLLEHPHGEEAVDLLGKLLRYDPTRRISAEEALEHPLYTRCFAEWDEEDDVPALRPAPFHDDSGDCRSVQDIMGKLRILADHGNVPFGQVG
eukprot:TRINITY_DN5772_c4_g1_i1.p1 TRINITY_DN5772_c4_g1~~TRINITY_DN5772_c4_g1_i1.p1  ORF type:complete len:513 (+),score=180.98 TRINITY_DN5772_c4_g1_i1:78-1541(+)